MSSYLISPLVVMIAFFQIASEYKLPGLIILIGYPLYLVGLNYAPKKKIFIAVVVLSLISLVIAYKLQDDFWAKKNKEVCEKLKADPACELTDHGYSCGVTSSFGEYKASKKMCEAYLAPTAI